MKFIFEVAGKAGAYLLPFGDQIQDNSEGVTVVDDRSI